jgi:dihydroorotase
MYDLLIRGGRVIDPAQNIDGQMDVAVRDGKVVPEIIAAKESGVILDVANGINNMAYGTARRTMEQGLLPTTISTDVTKSSVAGPAYGLTVTMSKLLELGLPFEDMIAMTTLNPAKAVRPRIISHTQCHISS